MHHPAVSLPQSLAERSHLGECVFVHISSISMVHSCSLAQFPAAITYVYRSTCCGGREFNAGSLFRHVRLSQVRRASRGRPLPSTTANIISARNGGGGAKTKQLLCIGWMCRSRRMRRTKTCYYAMPGLLRLV